MNQDSEHLRLLSIFHYVVAGVAAFCSFFPLLYTVMGFVFVALSYHPPTNPAQQPPPAALGWGACRSWNFSFLAWRSICHRSGFCRPLTFPPKTLLVRIHCVLYRMPLCPIRNDSWRVYDYRALAPVGEDVVFKCRRGALKLDLTHRLG